MPRIFDNIHQHLVDFAQENLKISYKSDICVGYFNLSGWKQIADSIQHYQGDTDHQVRLLVGMTQLPHDQLRLFKQSHSNTSSAKSINDILELKNQVLQQFQEQLTFGLPNLKDSDSLKQLIADLKSKKLAIKLFLDYPLHAKLYLFFHENNYNNPITGCLGSSNLTLSGLKKQGELNIDVLDHDTCYKLSDWFNQVWNNRYCLDISAELIDIIEHSWINDNRITPYEIYIKIVYHLAYEARLSLFDKTSLDFIEEEQLFEYQKSAVKMLVRYIEKRDGALLGDVVGLGKTMMAVAVSKIFNLKYGYETLIICPPNLIKMWENYKETYQLSCKIISVQQVLNKLPDRRYRLVIIDESHNLRNKDGKRYEKIKDYLVKNESKVLLLSATPYNKHYDDLANQLALFLDEEQDLGIRPEHVIRQEFKGNERLFCMRKKLSSARTLQAFRMSEYPEDWQNLMRLYMVRRTRSFILKHYAQEDHASKRRYISVNNTQLFFPTRIAKTIKLDKLDHDQTDQFSQLHSETVVSVIETLILPRYNLGGYQKTSSQMKKDKITVSKTDQDLLQNLSNSKSRLIGFCRTNLFKRLESSGFSFIQSIKSHVLRNYIFMYAIDNQLDLPIGTLDAKLLPNEFISVYQSNENNLKKSYDALKNAGKRYQWLNSKLFDSDQIRNALASDCKNFLEILNIVGDWNSEKDQKLNKLIDLIQTQYVNEKVLIFTQFSDTADYLNQQFTLRKVEHFACVTGDTDDVSKFTYKFSPNSNRYKLQKDESELRILIATDVLSEGQNLQDCSIVVNYDLPWAIIRLIQRAGRVDRIGQQSDHIKCYSFLPADGIEEIIKLRSRVNKRLEQNLNVVGSDEHFFEEQMTEQQMKDLYDEKSNVLDDDTDDDVDLSSYAFSIWKEAISKNPELEHKIPTLPLLSHATKKYNESDTQPDDSLIVFCKTNYDGDYLAWINRNGESISESAFEILKVLKCEPHTENLAKSKCFYELFDKAFEYISESCKSLDTQGLLGRKQSVRRQIYDILKEVNQADLYRQDIYLNAKENNDLKYIIELIYNYPLHAVAEHYLRSLLNQDDQPVLIRAILNLYYDKHLCKIPEKTFIGHEKVNAIVCAMGLK